MCFSATASFSVAIVTGVIGIAAVRQVKHWREYMLAATPFLFAIQQATEGILWLQLSGGGDGDTIVILAFIFRVFAVVLWPVFTALAVLLIEPNRSRRHVLLVIFFIGLGISGYFLTGLLSEPSTVAIRGHSIDYTSAATTITWLFIPYALCTLGALLLSSHRAIQVFGMIVLVGFLISAYAFLATFTSVWCFFAAAASTLIYFYFKREAVIVRPYVNNF